MIRHNANRHLRAKSEQNGDREAAEHEPRPIGGQEHG
jgi:hypothetical protein